MNPGSYIPVDYLPVLIMMIAGTVFALGILLVSAVLRLTRPYPEKLATYESGNPPVGEPRQRFSVRFYIIGMLFVVFDVEVIFLYPWAVSYGATGVAALTAVAIFIGIILLGYLYDWKRGALE